MSPTAITKAKTPKGQFTGWHMLALMIAFFGVIISVNVFMAISATRTWTGLVVENSYVASQEFNEKLANARAQEAAGWQGGLDYKSGVLTFTLIEGAKPLEPVEVIVSVARPIGTEGEQRLTLTRNPSGAYTTPLTLEDGVWVASIVARFADGPDYEHHARLNVTQADR